MHLVSEDMYDLLFVCWREGTDMSACGGKTKLLSSGLACLRLTITSTLFHRQAEHLLNRDI